MKFTVNTQTLQYSGDADMPLLWYLRDLAGLRGTKFGCGIGACGACTVHVNGSAVRCCVLRMGDLEGNSVTTIEGLESRVGRALKQAWTAQSVPQCGYCQPGMIMVAACDGVA